MHDDRLRPGRYTERLCRSHCKRGFGREIERCPYDGAPVAVGVDVVEEAIRLAEAQGADIEFVPTGEVGDLAGVAALLRF